MRHCHGRRNGGCGAGWDRHSLEHASELAGFGSRRSDRWRRRRRMKQSGWRCCPRRCRCGLEHAVELAHFQRGLGRRRRCDRSSRSRQSGFWGWGRGLLKHLGEFTGLMRLRRRWRRWREVLHRGPLPDSDFGEFPGGRRDAVLFGKPLVQVQIGRRDGHHEGGALIFPDLNQLCHGSRLHGSQAG